VILIDSDMIVEILKQNSTVLSNFQSYSRTYGFLFVSSVSLYEVERGLHVRQATVQQKRWIQLKPQLKILTIDEQVAASSVQIYLHLLATNQFLPDADIFIAATAFHHQLTLATGNQRHHGRIPGLKWIDWRQTTSAS
jgi:tRNA(fMet)-specific endonuclease VapC